MDLIKWFLSKFNMVAISYQEYKDLIEFKNAPPLPPVEVPVYGPSRPQIIKEDLETKNYSFDLSLKYVEGVNNPYFIKSCVVNYDYIDRVIGSFDSFVNLIQSLVSLYNPEIKLTDNQITSLFSIYSNLITTSLTFNYEGVNYNFNFEFEEE